MPTPKSCEGVAIEQYDVYQALDSIRNAPSDSAARAIWRLLDPKVREELSRAAHKVAGERACG